jgi:hypothetical protein
VTRTRAMALAVVALLALVVVVVLVVRDDDGDDDARDDTASATTSTADRSEGAGDGTDEGVANQPPGPAEPGDESPPPVTDGGFFPGEVADPVPLDAATDFGDGVAVRLASIEATTAEGSLPGERSGPAVAVTVEMSNGSERSVSVGNVTVDLIDADGVSAPPVVDPERPPLRGELAPGESRSGTYVFSLEPEDRDGVTVTVKYSGDTPMVLFVGDIDG